MKKWSAIVLTVLALVATANTKPGIRSPPEQLFRQNAAAMDLDESTEEIVMTTPRTVSLPVTQKTTSSPKLPVVGQTVLTTPPKVIANSTNGRAQSRLPQVRDNFEYETSHMGVAVPLTQEDIEREMKISEPKKPVESSTSKEGISTWILLSGGNPTTSTTAKPAPTIKPASVYRPDVKVDKIAKVEGDGPVSTRRPTMKPKAKTTERPQTNFGNKEETRSTVAPPPKKPTTPKPTQSPTHDSRPVLVRKKPSKKPTTPPTSNSSKKGSSTVAPETSSTPSKPSPTPTAVAVTESPPVTSTTIESTTFLILEPKDADFDLPEDRSPGPTTKAPKRKSSNKNKNKNKTKTKNEPAEKKPTKSPANKEKPITTQIYNYLAREVMPTVGVGLVGLAVTAGLATYFLGPFGALRRSYDTADRKDDMYFYNNEEYAGSDGHSEEEVFGKVIAGMPANSPYRNNLKYSLYRNNRPNPGGPVPGAVVPGQRPGYDQMYPASGANIQYRYRNANVPAPGGYPEQNVHPVYKKNQQQNGYPPHKYFRYNTDASMYRNNGQSVITAAAAAAEVDQPQQSVLPSAPSVDIVTAQKAEDPGTDSVAKEDESVLRRRSQFVVGSVQPEQLDVGVEEQQLTVDYVPEHGPRRRRRAAAPLDMVSDFSDDRENEIEGIVHVRLESTTPSTASTVGPPKEDITTTTPMPFPAHESSSDSGDIETTTAATPPSTVGHKQQTIFDLIRSLFEVKVRMGLSFLQNTTMAFQRYLKAVEKRVDESKLFSRDH